MNYGDLGKRFIASLIDYLIISFISVILSGMSFRLMGLNIAFFTAELYTVSFIHIVYFVAFEGSHMSATPGKRIMDLYVADINGNGITYTTAILRYIGKIFSSITLGLGYFTALFSNEKQTLHDMLAKTYVLSGSTNHTVNFFYKQNVQQRAGSGKMTGHVIIALTGPLAGSVYPVNEAGVMIGREPVNCKIVVPKTQTAVSRTHCLVTYNPMSGMFVLSDRGSTHGTFLANGKKVSPSVPEALRSGDRFYLATPSNTFEVR